MSGRRYILDTNAIIALLKGHQELLDLLHQAEWMGISIISRLEFLSFPRLTESDEILFYEFVKRVDVIELKSSESDLLELIVQIKKQNSLKLPDAIIAATALKHRSTLITADSDFRKVTDLDRYIFRQPVE